MKELQNYGVQELSLENQRKIEGGAIGCITVAIIAAICVGAGVGVGYYINR